MSDDVTASDDRLRELAQEATPGPWEADEPATTWRARDGHVRTTHPDFEDCADEIAETLSNDDAQFIAAASPDVLLGLLDRLAVVEAERDELARWKAEAIPVLDGLQEIGKALDLPLGTQITGPQALGAIEVLLAERDRLAAAVERVKALCESWRRISAAWSSLDVLTADEKADVEALGYRDGVRTAARDLRAVLSDAGRGK